MKTVRDACKIQPNALSIKLSDQIEKLDELIKEEGDGTAFFKRTHITQDLWDGNQSAHAQVIDLNTGKEAATQVGALVLTASLSTAVNAVKGLTREEMVECLASPLREPSEFLTAFEELEKSAWYLHHTAEGRYCFDRQENLTKLLQSLAQGAPDNQVDDLIRHR